MRDWTPDMPLRADATDRQIGERIDRVYNHSVARGDWTSGAVGIAECFVAREFAAACVGASAVAPDTRLLDDIADYGWATGGGVWFTINMVSVEAAKALSARLKGRDAARATPTGETK